MNREEYERGLHKLLSYRMKFVSLSTPKYSGVNFWDNNKAWQPIIYLTRLHSIPQDIDKNDPIVDADYYCLASANGDNRVWLIARYGKSTSNYLSYFLLDGIKVMEEATKQYFYSYLKPILKTKGIIP